MYNNFSEELRNNSDQLLTLSILNLNNHTEFGVLKVLGNGGGANSGLTQLTKPRKAMLSSMQNMTAYL